MNNEDISREDENPLESIEERRDFLGKFTQGIFGGLVATGVVSALFPSNANAKKEDNNLNESTPFKPFALPEKKPGEDSILRMMRDIQRALKKPIEQRKWKMVIDLRKCVGCDACSVACAAENKLPPGVVYRPVLQQEVGKFPNVGHVTLPRPCMQCNEPPCVPVCPVEATWSRPDGIVAVDYDQCIGCRYCITACPYNARTFDFGLEYISEAADAPNILLGKDKASKYETEASFEYAKEWKREGEESPIGNARKCHFCIPRIEKGMLPECTVTCIGRATYFGDGSDPDSLVAELIALPNAFRLKEEKGTHPNVYYIK
jgi:molybdopterin-containing oxidoreductase family iron-sulfur binding subunit